MVRIFICELGDGMDYRINQLIDHALAAGRITGTVVLVYQDGQPVFQRAAGFADREANLSVQFDTIFRLASVTKPIVAATALAMIERGLLSLSDRVTDHLPWFHPKTENGETVDITIHQLLTHTSGLVYGPESDELPADRIDKGLGDTDLDFEANFSRCNAIPLAFRPGTQWAYGFSTDILGAIIAKLHGTTLEDAVVHYIAGPLGMADTRFHVTDPGRLAVAYADAHPIPIRMPDPCTVVHESSGWQGTFSPNRIFNPKAFQSGGAGMAGTAGDIMSLLEALRTGGKGVLKPETIDMGFSNQIGAIEREDPGMKFGYFGAVVEDPAPTMSPHSKGTVRWGGVYGLSWFIDRAKGLSVLSVTNNAVEGCMGEYPERIKQAVYGA
jgi:CubicO group peptidase (beta-lactamase class C family)